MRLLGGVAILVLLFSFKPAFAEKRGLTIFPEAVPLMFPEDLKKCHVFNSQQFLKTIQRATWTGECEWIVMRPSTDEVGGPLWLSYDMPIVVDNKHPAAARHPLVISNETGRSVIVKQPKNGGCAFILCKPDFAMMGILTEGAICSCHERTDK